MQLRSRFKNRKVITHIPFSLSILLIGFDIISFVLAYCCIEFFLALLVQHSSVFQDINTTNSDNNTSQKLFFLLGIITTIILWAKGLYTNRTPYWSQVHFITKAVIFASIIHLLISSVLGFWLPIIPTLFIWLLVYFLLIVLRAIGFYLIRLSPDWSIPTVIISDTQTAEDLTYAFSSDLCTGYAVKHIFLRQSEDTDKFDVSLLSSSDFDKVICYGQESHEDFISKNPQYFYIVSLDTFRDTARESIIHALNDNGAPYAIVPTISRANLYQMEPRYFFGHDVVMLYVGNSTPQIFGMTLSRILKRVMDIVISGFFLIFLFPVFIIIAASLKLEGQNGSPFYGGRRIGKNGNFFNCWKFRSMEPNSNHLLENYLNKNPEAKENWEKYRKLPNDPRITTKTARFIRKTSVDELPQLWNVLIGDMSLVGPRPILEDETHYFERNTLKEYMSVRPGLTGLWQVSGRNKTSFKRRVYWDSWYVRNWSLWGDIVILIKTPLVLISRKGAS